MGSVAEEQSSTSGFFDKAFHWSSTTPLLRDETIENEQRALQVKKATELIDLVKTQNEITREQVRETIQVSSKLSNIKAGIDRNTDRLAGGLNDLGSFLNTSMENAAMKIIEAQKGQSKKTRELLTALFSKNFMVMKHCQEAVQKTIKKVSTINPKETLQNLVNNKTDKRYSNG
ncbi:MAG: hypothetical protein OEL89_01935, partial [Candidatus Peregrinibacteria bacterium]|nr:hypothetical protein [Candidatus Peregrinibacteria bacterium]